MCTGCRPRTVLRPDARNVRDPDDKSWKRKRTPMTGLALAPPRCSNTRGWRRLTGRHTFCSSQAESNDGFRPDHSLAVSVWTQGFRNNDRTVLLLIVLHDCDPGPSHSEPGPVQRVDKPYLFARARPVFDVGPASLETIKIAARRNFTVSALPRKPHFDVIALGCGESHISGGMDHHAVGDFQALQNLLRVLHQRFQLRVRIFRTREFHQLDLIELMLTENAANILTVRTCLTAEARRIRRELNRQSFTVNNVAPIYIRDRNFRSWNEVVVGSFDLELVLFKFRQLGRSEEALGVRHEWRNDFFIAVLLRVDVQHEIDQSTLHPGPDPCQQRETGSCNFRGPFEIQDS